MKSLCLQVAALRNELAGGMPCGFKQQFVQQALSQFSSTLPMCRGICIISHTHQSFCRWWPCAMSWWAKCLAGPGSL